MIYFKVIETSQSIEEKELSDYQDDRFYPVRLGEIFQQRYQVVAKLGFGTSSTTWLARNLKNRQYVALKVGRTNIRRLLDLFEITGEHSNHIILVFEAAQMSLRDMKPVFRPEGFDETFVQGTVTKLIEALDNVYNCGEVVHTDIHPGNMLLGAYNDIVMQRLEEKETTSPMEGPMLLSDFGEARVGPGPYHGDIMPLEYRSPEILLHIGWSYPVDIWSVDLATLHISDKDSDVYDAAHLAQLIAALGPPPPEFLARGDWLSLAPITELRTMKALETQLLDSPEFLRFI
ncbi:kinase-like domain-containing protein [Aspergillus novoparasiticus]|uniref:non-specific serine/threonine protein kinase n=1 Tax=Aspergillus novoparasiticus TaxID=986946 RepID=A0A5N6E7L6_9EURO|nr:kinase-like domain-containing protein [Aspergillus novoparasiticus]